MPGWELVSEGLRDIELGRRTVASAAVQLASSRLSALGIEVQLSSGRQPSHELYELLAAQDPDGAHSRYNAVVRRLASFARAAEHAPTG